MKLDDRMENHGIIYSTNPNFRYESDNDAEVEHARPNEKQLLKLSLDKRNRGGKVVTLISGFVGPEESLNELAKKLKTRCGVGGSVKDGEIIIQGDMRTKVAEILKSERFKVK
ncbi:MAG: translation initiation factor [Tannerellaceae bacterium]|jgi:translation initiation factor 1|nr:translation initiation factor [Tannerellaceae bacterium]